MNLEGIVAFSLWTAFAMFKKHLGRVFLLDHDWGSFGVMRPRGLQFVRVRLACTRVFSANHHDYVQHMMFWRGTRMSSELISNNVAMQGEACLL
jgi:hypothetical protein